MRHRHLTYAPGQAVEDLPAAAILDILDRGDLADWQPIAARIARDPSGEFAERVASLVEAHLMYGTTALWQAWIERLRARAGESGPAGGRVSLAHLRRRSHLTQARLADRIGMTQSDLSKFERRDDVRLSTLRSYVEGLGGMLRLVVQAERWCVELDVEPQKPLNNGPGAGHSTVRAPRRS